MLIPRIIPSLLLSQGGLVKTRRFKQPQYVGDPINAVKVFNDKEVDEIIILDIDATKRGSGPDFSLIEELAEQCFMPLCYGGGIRNEADARTLFALGVEKVCLQTSFLEDPSIVRAISDRNGEQAVVVSIDVKKDWRGRSYAFNAAGRPLPTRDWKTLIRSAIDAGAGEIFLSSVDRDGTLAGMDLQMISEAGSISSAPVIAAGGAASLSDFRLAIDAGASAVSAGAYFVLYGPHRAVLITYPSPEEIRGMFAAEA